MSQLVQSGGELSPACTHRALDHTRYIIGSKDLWCTQCKQQHETQPMWWFLFCTHLLSIVQYFMFCSLDFVTDLQNEIKKRNTNLDPVACLCQRICFFDFESATHNWWESTIFIFNTCIESILSIHIKIKVVVWSQVRTVKPCAVRVAAF